MVREMVSKLYDHNTPITYCSLHASFALHITHISFTYTVSRLTSTLIRSVKCYKKDYHEKKTRKKHMYYHQYNYYMYTMY